MPDHPGKGSMLRGTLIGLAMTTPVVISIGLGIYFDQVEIGLAAGPTFGIIVGVLVSKIGQKNKKNA